LVQGESPPTTHPPIGTPLAALLAALIMLAVFAIASAALDAQSLWGDEIWSLWAVHSPRPAETLARVAADVHPPLYFILLDGWVALVGESEYAARMLSTLFAMLALAATYAIGRRLFDEWAALFAIAILGTSGFFLYYAREARMYSLLVLLASLTTLAYLRWAQRDTWPRRLVYSLLMAALVYTHYHGAWVLATHLVHLLLTRPRRWRGWLAAAGLAVIGYLPWLPTLLTQIRVHPDGPLAVPIPTNRATVDWLARVLTSGRALLVAAPFVLGCGLLHLPHYRRAVSLLLVWLLLTPLIVLALNAWVVPVYQVRYVIAILPAWALLIAYGLRHVFWRPLALALLALLVAVQLSAYPGFWGTKPDWRGALARLIDARRPHEPLLIDADAHNVVTYYDRRLGIRRGEVIDLTGQPRDPAARRAAIDALSGAPSVWVILPINAASSWDTLAALDATRHAGYRDGVVNMIFYRFDHRFDYRFDVGGRGDLRFRFGDLLGFDAGPGPGGEMGAHPGERVCVDLSFTTRLPLDGLYSAGVHVIDATGRSVAQWDGGLGVHEAGERITLAPCLDLPAALPPGVYHLQMNVYNWSNLERLPLIEDSAHPDVYFGDTLVLAALSVTGGE
jgi:hypothetical protein